MTNASHALLFWSGHLFDKRRKIFYNNKTQLFEAVAPEQFGEESPGTREQDTRENGLS